MKSRKKRDRGSLPLFKSNSSAPHRIRMRESMRGTRRAVLLVLFLIVSLGATALEIKIGSLAPADTLWDAALRQLARKWNEVTNGEVDMKIYGAGIAGDEADMLRKVRLGQLHGAALSGTGINRISSDTLVLSLPLLFDGYNELQYVLEHMSPTFEALIEEKGFKLAAWTTVGFVHFFGQKPIVTVDDLRGLKIAVSAEDEEILHSWRSSGFDALPLHTTEILAGLQTGMAQAYHAPPIIAAVYQWFALSPYMSSLDIAPLVAGLIINERTWRRIPSRYHEDLIETSKEILTDLYDSTLELEEQAIEVMLANGLVINEVPESAMDDWYNLMQKGYDILVGTAISPEIFEETVRYRDEYRAMNE